MHVHFKPLLFSVDQTTKRVVQIRLQSVQAYPFCQSFNPRGTRDMLINH